jgi:hypothetical protein
MSRESQFDEVFGERWIQQTATAVFRDMQLNFNPMEMFPSRRDGIRGPVPAWCFNRTEKELRSFGAEEIEAWKRLHEYPQLLRGALAEWAKDSMAIKECPPQFVESLGLVAEDVRIVVGQLVLESAALRSYVLTVTESLLRFFDSGDDEPDFKTCDREVHGAGERSMVAFKTELEVLVSLELPGIARKVEAVRWPLQTVRTPIVIPEFPTYTSHSEIAEDADPAPWRVLVPSPNSSSPGCIGMSLTDESWQLRIEYFGEVLRKRAMISAALSQGKEPPDDAIYEEPIRRQMRLSDLTLAILIRGAPEYRRRTAHPIEQAVHGVFRTLDAALLVDSTERVLVFDSMLKSMSAGASRQHSASAPQRSEPKFLQSPPSDIKKKLEDLINSGAFWQQRHRNRMEAVWMRHLHSASAAIDESVIKSMLEVCIARSAQVAGHEQFNNPIAKGFREINHAVRLRGEHPTDALVIAVTSLETTLLHNCPRNLGKSATLTTRITKLLGCDSDHVTANVKKWANHIYDTRSRVVHGELVDEGVILRDSTAAVFLASACMLKICTLLRFKQRLGLTPTNQSCAAVLADCLRSLDDPDSADTRADHFALSKWPAELFDASLQT